MNEIIEMKSYLTFSELKDSFIAKSESANSFLCLKNDIESFLTQSVIIMSAVELEAV